MINPTEPQPETGISVDYCDTILVQQLLKLKPTTVVDFGAGNGKNGRLIREAGMFETQIKAIEGYSKSAQILQMQTLYNSVETILIQDWVEKDNKSYDLAIFGDVLEHLTPKEIHTTLRKCISKFKHIIIVCPLHDIFQEEMGGNPLEVHKTYVTKTFFNRYNIKEQHITKGGYTIMNVLINTEHVVRPRSIRFFSFLFHNSILFFQLFGKGLSFVKFIKWFTKRYQWMFNKARKEVLKDLQ